MSRHWMDHKERFYELIGLHLKGIELGLQNFEQTCHGSFCVGDPFESFGRALGEALKDPSAFNISELSQALRRVMEGPAKKLYE